MNEALLIGAVAGGVVAGIGSAIVWIRGRARTRHFIQVFQRGQQLLVSPQQYEVVDDAESDPLFASIAEEQTNEVGLHAAKLADIRVSWGDTKSAVRVFVDDEKTTLIYIQNTGNSTQIRLESHTEDQELHTGPTPMLWVIPPFHLVQTLSPRATVGDRLDAHREFVSQNARAHLLRFGTAADVIKAWEQIQERTIEWRESQSPDELFERDLSMMLGPDYKSFCVRIRNQLRAPMPKATAR